MRSQIKYSTVDFYNDPSDFGQTGTALEVDTTYHVEVDVTSNWITVAINESVVYNASKAAHVLYTNQLCWVRSNVSGRTGANASVSNILITTPIITNSPTTEPTSFPTMDRPDECDYWYPGPIDIAFNQTIDNIMLYDVMELSFQLKTEVNWTMPTNETNYEILKIGEPQTSSKPKLPQMNFRVNAAGNPKWKTVVTNDSGDNVIVQFGNSNFQETFNDGSWHQYDWRMSPNELYASYDDNVSSSRQLGYWGEYSQYLNSSGSEYTLFIGSDMSEDFTSGTIRSLCITTYAWTDAPTLAPTVDPTRAPTKSPTTLMLDISESLVSAYIF